LYLPFHIGEGEFLIDISGKRMAFVNQLTRRGFASSPKMAAKIHEVVIIGGGLMGAGIAQVRRSSCEV
jgi:hypothetical protein